jgi:hypothetical protein
LPSDPPPIASAMRAGLQNVVDKLLLMGASLFDTV